VIRGVGTDIVKIDRLRKSTDKLGRRFLEKIFTEEEIKHCYRKKDPFPSLAVRFAAKEALIKALPTETGVTFKDIDVKNTANGKPSIIVGERLKVIFDENNINSAHLSLSHEKEYGVAIVVLEGP
jgi:holo-[acyl-carrier protein] synthase